MKPTDFLLLKCNACGAKNKIPAKRAAGGAKCGKCGEPLEKHTGKTDPSDAFKMRCADCGTQNRIPASKINAGPKCGKCGATMPTRELFVPQPVMVTDANFDKSVLKSPLPVLLFAWAPWCPTCSTVAPIIDDFASESKARIRVGKINVDANPALASKFNILSVPFLFIFDGGQMRENFPGGMQKHELMLKMAHYL